jgi:hypothetical protein
VFLTILVVPPPHRPVRLKPRSAMPAASPQNFDEHYNRHKAGIKYRQFWTSVMIENNLRIEVENVLTKVAV